MSDKRNLSWKKGDKIVCIDANRKGITKGKEYTLIRSYLNKKGSSYVVIKNDTLREVSLYSVRFLPLKLERRLKIEKINGHSKNISKTL